MPWAFARRLTLETESMKLSRIVTGIFSVALLAFLVTDALGQDQGRRGRGGPPGGGPGGGFGGFGRGGGDPTMGLLRMDEVKAELQISPDQEEALTKLAEQGRGERPEGVDFRNMSEEERNAFFAKMQKEQQERNKKMKEQLEEVLLPDQMDRLNEIALQVRGVQALSDEKVAADLKITAEQKKRLEEVREELQQKSRDQMRELFTSGDREKMREAFAKIRQDMEDGILGVLSSEQQKEFEKMKGEKFDMPEGAGRGGFGGGPRGGDRGGAGGRPGGGRPRGDGEGRRPRPETEEN